VAEECETRAIRRRALAPVLAVAATALALTTAAAADPVLDQWQPVFGSTLSLGIGGGPRSDQKLGQVVTAGIAGRVSAVGLVVACDGGSGLLLQIQEAPLQGASQVLSSHVVTGIGPDFPTAFRTYALATPVFMARGSKFAIVLHSTGSCGMRPGPDGDPYPGGQGYFDARPNPPGWLCLCSFPGFWDLPFQTFVEPACGVPGLEGETVAAATEALTRSGCVLGKVSRVFSRSVPAGMVISQSPVADTILAPGAAVSLTVSRGRQPCVVPNLRRLTLARAKVRSTKAGCRLGRVRRTTSRLASGLIVSQQPAPGKRLRPGAKVDVVVSRGPRR
jgi:PASTA domain